MRIGILEDEATQKAIYKLLLASTQYEYEIYDSIASFQHAISNERYDLLLIDWILPDGTAENTLKWIRENLGWDIPVICVTSCNDESDVVKVLNLGADDYFVKSVKHFELLARIQSLLRRVQAKQSHVIQFGPFEINQKSHEITASGKPVELTQKEFELANYLFHNPNKLLSRVHLLEKIWSLMADVDTRTIDTHVSRLRRKLKFSESNWDIQTVYGYGYRLISTV